MTPSSRRYRAGVLTRGQLDNGRGLARGHCFRHKHEVDNGRTSSVSQLTLGFGTNGSVTNYSSVRPHTQEEVLKESSKLVTFVDLCGHERYLKTTVFGLTGASRRPVVCPFHDDVGGSAQVRSRTSAPSSWARTRACRR